MGGGKPDSQADRKTGRTMACEGMMAAQFGRRSSQAGAKAIERLRGSDISTPALSPEQLGLPVLEAPHAPGQGRWMWAAAVTALVLAAGASLFFTGAWPEQDQATLEVLDGTAFVERGGRGLNPGRKVRLAAGDVIKTQNGSQVAIRWDKGSTRIFLADKTELVFKPIRQSRSIEVERGSLEVTYAANASGRPLVLTTPQAEAVITGTRFTLAARATSTWLEVEEGTVAIRPRDQQGSIQVGSGECAVVAPGLALTTRPVNQRWQAPYCVASTSMPRRTS